MEDVAARVAGLEKSRGVATREFQALEQSLGMSFPPFTGAEPCWPMDYCQYAMTGYPQFDPWWGCNGFSGGMGMGAEEDPIAMLAARVSVLEAFKEEASLHLRLLKKQVDALSANKGDGEITPTTASTVPSSDDDQMEHADRDQADASSSDEMAVSLLPPGIVEPPGLEMQPSEAASDVFEAPLPPQPDSVMRQPSEAISEFSEPPSEPDAIMRHSSELLTYDEATDHVQVSWVLTNFKAKMLRQLGRPAVSPGIDYGDFQGMRIMISPLGSVDKLPRTRKEKSAYSSTLQNGPFCPSLQLKAPTQKELKFCFVLGEETTAVQTHDFSSSPVSIHAKLGETDWLKHLVDGELKLSLKIFI